MVSKEQYVNLLYSQLKRLKRTPLWTTLDNKIEFYREEEGGWLWSAGIVSDQEAEMLSTLPQHSFQSRKQILQMIQEVGLLVDTRMQNQVQTVYGIEGLLDVFGHQGSWIVALEYENTPLKYKDIVDALSKTPLLDYVFSTRKAAMEYIVDVLTLAERKNLLAVF